MNVSSRSKRKIPQLHAGDVVEVLSAQEILATLDEKGEFENLPFMPEMLEFCGRRMIVDKVAHKVCEVITGQGGLYWLNGTVHLRDARCTGSAHGGCQTACSLYWKEAWLRPVSNSERSSTLAPAPSAAGADVSTLERATRKEPGDDGSERFSCQATEILRATNGRIRFWEPSQYFADVKSGNASVLMVARGILFHLFNVYQNWSRRFLPRWLLIKEGLPWGFVKGRAGGQTPTGRLDLQPGEFVRIKSKDAITQTLNDKRQNRGMGFEEEMARFCGKTSKVVGRVERCIDERTGKMLTMKNPCIVLEGVFCRGVYHSNCPRGYVSFWREIWLERVGSDGK